MTMMSFRGLLEMRHVQCPVSDIFCVLRFTAGFGEGPDETFVVVDRRVQGVGWLSSLTRRVILR